MRSIVKGWAIALTLATLTYGQTPGGTGNSGSIVVLPSTIVQAFAGASLFCSALSLGNNGNDGVQVYCYTDWQTTKKVLVLNQMLIVPAAGLITNPDGTQTWASGSVVEWSQGGLIITFLFWRHIGETFVSWQAAVNADSKTLQNGHF